MTANTPRAAQCLQSIHRQLSGGDARTAGENEVALSGFLSRLPKVTELACVIPSKMPHSVLNCFFGLIILPLNMQAALNGVLEGGMRRKAPSKR